MLLFISGIILLYLLAKFSKEYREIEELLDKMDYEKNKKGRGKL